MKKILVIAGLIFTSGAANAKVESYASIKTGFGGATLYVDGDTELGDWLVELSNANTGTDGYKYGSTGLLWELTGALGVDWTPGNAYDIRNQNQWFHIRAEAEFGYNHYRQDGKLKYDYTVSDTVTINFNQMFLLANGYADFRIDKIAPYVGLGVGYTFGTNEISLRNAYGEFNDSANENGVIYALHLGMGYKYSDITTFDFGARRVYIPTTDDGKYVFDSVRIGARYRI